MLLNREQIIKWLRDPASQRPETAKFLERAAELLEGDAQYLPQQTDAVLADAIALLAKAQGKANIENWRDDVFSARQLLASLPPPEAKDGAAPSPETGWRLVAWLHEVREPDKDWSYMLSKDAEHPWSHWIAKHKDQCEFRSTPLYATTSVQPK